MCVCLTSHKKHFIGLLERNRKLSARKADPNTLALEPAHGLPFADSVSDPKAACPVLLICNAETWAAQHPTGAQVTDDNVGHV